MNIAALYRNDFFPWANVFAQGWSFASAEETSSANSREEADEIAAAQRGDGEAFEQIVRRHQNAIALQLGRFSRDLAIVEELTHDTFVEAYLSLKSYRSSAPLLHWLRRIAVRVGYRYWTNRRQTRERFASGEAIVEDVATSHDTANHATDAAEEVAHILERLPPRDRLILTLMYLDECSVAEIADRTGWSRIYVKVQAFRARKKLQASLGVERHE